SMKCSILTNSTPKLFQRTTFPLQRHAEELKTSGSVFALLFVNFVSFCRIFWSTRSSPLTPFPRVQFSLLSVPSFASLRLRAFASIFEEFVKKTSWPGNLNRRKTKLTKEMQENRFCPKSFCRFFWSTRSSPLPPFSPVQFPLLSVRPKSPFVHFVSF